MPRLLDVTFDILELLQHMGNDEGMLVLVLDFCKAFWHLPAIYDETPYLVFGHPWGRRMCFTRAPKGDRGAPLLWARLVAMVARLSQRRFRPREARMSV